MRAVMFTCDISLWGLQIACFYYYSKIALSSSTLAPNHPFWGDMIKGGNLSDPFSVFFLSLFHQYSSASSTYPTHGSYEICRNKRLLCLFQKISEHLAKSTQKAICLLVFMLLGLVLVRKQNLLWKQKAIKNHCSILQKSSNGSRSKWKWFLTEQFSQLWPFCQ